VSKLRISTNENFRQAARFIGTTISAAAFQAIRLFTNAFYRYHRALFDSRIREGRILDCHGDLHLEHIHLSPGRLTIFDCIEFNDRFRYIDVANDVAFLAMDFAFQGRPELGRHFAVRMARSLNDPDMLRILGFYQCYRAYVRGKVESIQQAAASVSVAERRAIHFRAENYFRLALRYAVCGSEPMVLIVMGSVGSGKSTLAQALAHELGCKAYSSDRIRKELMGIEPYKRGSASERRRLYSSKVSDKTYATLARHALEEVREHRAVVLDATFAGRRRREAVRRKLTDAKAAWCFIEVRAASATILERLKARDASTSEVSDARVDDLPFLNQSYEPPAELAEEHLVVVKSARNIDSVVRASLSGLARRRALSQD
jgi:predicted kinase